MSVAELRKYCPQCIPVFLRHHMACVGCQMAAFEPLADAARIYGLSPDQFWNELDELIQPISKE